MLPLGKYHRDLCINCRISLILCVIPSHTRKVAGLRPDEMRLNLTHDYLLRAVDDDTVCMC